MHDFNSKVAAKVVPLVKSDSILGVTNGLAKMISIVIGPLKSCFDAAKCGLNSFNLMLNSMN